MPTPIAGQYRGAGQTRQVGADETAPTCDQKLLLGQEPNCCDKYVLLFPKSCTNGDARTSTSNTMRRGEASSNDQPPDTVAIRRGPTSSRRNWTKLPCGSLLQRHRGRFAAGLVARCAQNLGRVDSRDSMLRGNMIQGCLLEVSLGSSGPSDPAG